MSSDESATENGVKQFRILKKEWRASRLTPWLRVFDSIARMKRINPVTESTRGADPRHRFESGKVDTTSPPVACLPCNAYDKTWLENRTPFARNRLQVRNNEYNFSHTSEILV